MVYASTRDESRIDEFRMIWSLLATAKKMALAGHPISLQLRLPAASLGLDVVLALLATIVFLHSS